jgi:catechol 2,3-dioxygenase-like lactoylglutathione lyase family enzyme
MSSPAVRVRGLMHVALRVRDVKAAVRFYRETFGMRVVWEPDPQNVYLSSGVDNLALHETASVPLAQAPKTHRDGSVSCYCRDPDGNLVQILYLPGTAE